MRPFMATDGDAYLDVPHLGVQWSDRSSHLAPGEILAPLVALPDDVAALPATLREAIMRGAA